MMFIAIALIVFAFLQPAECGEKKKIQLDFNYNISCKYNSVFYWKMEVTEEDIAINDNLGWTHGTAYNGEPSVGTYTTGADNDGWEWLPSWIPGMKHLEISVILKHTCTRDFNEAQKLNRTAQKHVECHFNTFKRCPVKSKKCTYDISYDFSNKYNLKGRYELAKNTDTNLQDFCVYDDIRPFFLD